jgi:hypothetical protein
MKVSVLLKKKKKKKQKNMLNKIGIGHRTYFHPHLTIN